MAQRDLFKRYLDAGMEFSALTQARAEAIVNDFVKAGEVKASQAQQAAQDLLERSRKNSERRMDQVRKEVRSTVASLGLATQADIARLERRLRDLDKKVGAAKKAPAARSSSAAKGTTKAKSSLSGSSTPRKSTPRKRS